MKIFRNFFLVLLSIICILLIPLTLVYESLNTTILKPYETINYLNESGIYQEAEIVIEEEIYKMIESMGSDTVIPSTIFSNIISKSITKEWISYFSKDIQTSLWQYIIGESDTIGVISLTEFNNYVKEMTENEISNILDSNPAFENLINSQIVGLLPESIDMNDYIVNVEKAKDYYQMMKLFEVYMYLVLAFILIFVLILSWNLRKTAKWLGVTFTITGFITFIPAILFNVIDKQIFYYRIQNVDFYKYFESSITSLVDLLVNDITINLSMFSFVVLIFGVFCLLLNKVLSRRSDRQKNIQK